MQTCHTCKQNIGESSVYKIYVRVYLFDIIPGHLDVALSVFLPGLEKYMDKKVYLLSPTQAVLFRPDIISDYIEKKIATPNNAEHFKWQLISQPTCNKCFEVTKEEHPVR